MSQLASTLLARGKKERVREEKRERVCSVCVCVREVGSPESLIPLGSAEPICLIWAVEVCVRAVEACVWKTAPFIPTKPLIKGWPGQAETGLPEKSWAVVSVG